MTAGRHLPPEIAFGYRRGLLTADELRAADAHLAACAECRERLEREMDAAGAAASLRDSLLAESAPARWPYWLATAAAVAVAVLAGLWYGMLRPGPMLLTGLQDEPATGAVTGEERRAVDAAIRSGRLIVPPVVSELASRREVLMGADQDTRMRVDLLSPAGTVVLANRPPFRWKTLPGEWNYRVRVYRADGSMVTESPAVSGGEWTAAHDLAPGINYQWQVEASRNGERSTYPGPPLTPPKFRVVDAPTAVAMRKLDGAPHLVRAVEYARAGLLDDARRELDEVAHRNPGSPVAARLLESLGR